MSVQRSRGPHRGVAQQRLDRNTSAGQRDNRDGKIDKAVRCCTVERRIRSRGKREGCRAQEVNAAKPQNPSEMLRCTALPAVKRERPRRPSMAHEESRAQRAARSEIARKPYPCSNRDSDWTGRRAWNRSTAYSVGPGSSRTSSPQIAGLTERPRPKAPIVSCLSC